MGEINLGPSVVCRAHVLPTQGVLTLLAKLLEIVALEALDDGACKDVDFERFIVARMPLCCYLGDDRMNELYRMIHPGAFN